MTGPPPPPRRPAAAPPSPGSPAEGPPVEHRLLGRTGLTVTRLGLGLAALGRPAYITSGRDADLGADRAPATMEARCHRVLDTAYGLGLRYVDAARSYGEAEAFLGRWLRARGLRPGETAVGSKWGYRYRGGWRLDAAVHEEKDHSRAMLEAQWAETQARLGPFVGLYQVHSATLESGVLEDRAVLRALSALGRRGVAIGLSVSGPAQAEVVRRALRVEVDGANPFTCVQATYNLLEPAAGDALAEAHAAGWGVIVKEALANGRLAPAPGARTGDAGGPALLASLGADRGVDTGQVALAAVLAEPWADVVLSGAVTESQLRANAGALAVRLDGDDRRRLTALREPAAEYWSRRSALPWR